MKNFKYTFILLFFSFMATFASVKESSLHSEIRDSLDLRACLEFAMDHNSKIQLAKEQTIEQLGLLLEIKSVALPRLTGSALFNKKDSGLLNNNDFGDSSQEDWHIGVEFRKAIFSGGGIQAAIDRQKETQDSVLMDLKAIVNQVTFEVSKDYWNVILAKDQIEVEKQNKLLLEEELENAKKRFETGAVSQFEVLRAEVLLSSAMPPLIRAKNRLKTSTDRLLHTIGAQNFNLQRMDSEKIPNFRGKLGYTPREYQLKDLLVLSLQNRAELRNLEHIIQKERAQLKVKKSLSHPQLDFVSTYALQKNYSSQDLDASQHGWQVGIEGSWNIFDGYKNRGQIRQTESKIKQAEINLNSQKFAIEVEIRQAFTDWQEAEELVSASRKIIDQAQEALRLANARYSAGSTTQLDVLQSQVNLTEARTQQLEAYYSNQIAIAHINKAIGTVLQ
jgi:outer membrane protein TolC